MYKKNSVFILFLFAIFVFTFAVECRAQDQEIEKLVSEVSVDSQKGAIFNYTYLMKFSYEKHKSLAGRKFTRWYEAILPSRFSLNRVYSHPFVLVKDSEKNVTDEEIMNARKDIARELEKAENEQEKSGAVAAVKPDETGGYWTMGFTANNKRIEVNVLQILKKSRLGNLQRRQIDGRSLASIDFAPDPAQAFEKTLAYLGKLEGRILIDETDKRIISVEGFAPQTFGALKDKPDPERQKELVFLFQQAKVAEGYWFPLTVKLNFAKHPQIFEPVEIEYSFSNYKKASVDVKEQIDSSKSTETEENKQ